MSSSGAARVQDPRVGPAADIRDDGVDGRVPVALALVCSSMSSLHRKYGPTRSSSIGSGMLSLIITKPTRAPDSASWMAHGFGIARGSSADLEADVVDRVDVVDRSRAPVEAHDRIPVGLGQ